MRFARCCGKLPLRAIASGVLGAVLVRFCAQFPRVVVNVEEANNVAHEYQMLRERKVDLLLGAITRPFVEEDLDAQVVYEDRPYITTGPTNRLACAAGWRSPSCLSSNGYCQAKAFSGPSSKRRLRQGASPFLG